MTRPKVRAVRAVDLGVAHLAEATNFFTTVWHLEVAAEQDGVLYLRGTGHARYILSLRATSRTEIIRILLDADDRQTVGAIHAHVRRMDSGDVEQPHALDWPGGGYGFGCKDPEGRNFAVVCGVEDHPDGSPRPDRPGKISHVNLNTAAGAATLAYLRDAFGFKLSDETRRMRFVRCNADHHSIVLCNHRSATLNHIAFEMPDIDSLMRGIGRMRDHGYPIEWGPGRHGPGNNVFAYFVGPERLPLEYTTDMQQCDASYVGRPTEEWTWPPGRLDHWGLTPGPSARFEETQDLFAFSADGHRT